MSLTMDGDGHNTKEIFPGLNEIKKRDDRCDATIQADDGKKLSVNRSVMSTCSPYFRALFTTPLKGSAGGDGPDRTSVSVPGVESGILMAIIHYAQTGETHVDFSNVEKLFPAVDQLLVDGMKQDCCRFLLKIISPTNCIGIMKFGREYLTKQLVDGALSYLTTNFEMVSAESDEILDVQFKDLLEILNSDSLIVSSEDVVWKCVLRWIEHRPEQRKPMLPDLLQVLRFGFYPRNEFLKNVLNHPLVTSDPRCKPVTISATASVYRLLSKAFLKQRKCIQMMRARFPDSVVFCIGGWSVNGPTNFFEMYDYKADAWVTVEDGDKSNGRAYHRCLILGTDLYVIGGTDGDHCLNTCRCYKLKFRKWVKVKPMLVRRCYLSAVALSGFIYAIGGYDGQRRLDLVERFRPHRNQWEYMPSMTEVRSDASACVISNRIMVVGGFNGVRYLQSAETYDPSRRTWTLIKPMIGPRSGITCVADKNLCYVLGGFQGMDRLRTCEVYDANTNMWRLMPPMITGRSNFSAVILKDHIYVFGGFNGVNTISTVEKFDLSTQTWEKGTSLKLGRSALASCVYSNVAVVKDLLPKNRLIVRDNLKRKHRSTSTSREKPTEELHDSIQLKGSDDNNL